jgi:hypothetical protein
MNQDLHLHDHDSSLCTSEILRRWGEIFYFITPQDLDLGVCDFYLCGNLKDVLRGRRVLDDNLELGRSLSRAPTLQPSVLRHCLRSAEAKSKIYDGNGADFVAK